ncbi:Pseudouridine-5'-phosphatase [Blomia tropicalis]|nr:Pseudouridine-5'-phosphatase [Blomia tropicalis]
MDGVIMDSEKLYETAYRNIAKQFNRKFSFELKMQMSGVPGLQNAELMINELKLPLTIEQYNVLYQSECNRLFSEPIDLMPGAEALIRHLHRNQIPIAIATSTRRTNYDMKTLRHKELFSLFDHIVIASDDPEIERGKPDPQPFLVCASRFKDKPTDMSKILVFEDSISGIQAANLAGMKSVWIPDPRIVNSTISCFLKLDSLEQFKPELVGLPPF